MSFLSSHRPFNRRFSEREARLCHEESSPESFSSDPRKWLQEIAYGMTWANAEIMASSVEALARIPLGIASGIYEVAKDRIGFDVQKLLRKAVNFVKTAPGVVLEWVTNIFDEQKDLTPEAMVNLMDLRLWILAFEGLNLREPLNDAEKRTQADEMLKAKKRIAAAGPELKPRDYLESLTTLERRQRFDALITSVIPKDSQTKFSAIFDKADPTERRNTIKDNQDTLVSAMKQMYGLDDGAEPSTDGTTIAKDSLHQLLFLNKTTATDKVHGASAGLKEEFLAHLDRRPGTMTPEGIMAKFAAGDPEASLLLGATKMGVVTQVDIDNRILPETEAQTTDLQLKSQEQRQLAEKTTRARQEELRRSAETITERFSQAPGWMKLALVIGLVGGAYKFPKTSAGIAAFFLGRYIFLKDNNPIDSTGQNIFALVDKLRGVTAVGPSGPSKEVDQVVEKMLKFLPNEAHENLSTAVTGFTLLAGLDVSVVADNFEPTEDGRMGVLKAWEPPVKDALKASLKARGMDSAAASRFFPSTDTREKGKDGKPISTIDCTKHKHLCETGDALASYFYLLGAYRVKTGTHTRKSLDMATLGLIEQARTSTTSTGYYDDIRNGLSMVHPQQGKPVDIRTEYYEVILEGLAEGKARKGQSVEEAMLDVAAKPVEPMAGIPGKEKGGAATEMASRESTTEANRDASDASTKRGDTATDISRDAAKNDARRGGAHDGAAERSADNDAQRGGANNGGAPRSTETQPDRGGATNAGRDSTEANAGRSASTESSSRANASSPSQRGLAQEPANRGNVDGQANSRSSDSSADRSSGSSNVGRGEASEASKRDGATGERGNASSETNRSNADGSERGGAAVDTGRNTDASTRRDTPDASTGRFAETGTGRGGANDAGQRTQDQNANRSGTETPEKSGTETQSGRSSTSGSRSSGSENTER